MGGSGKEEVFIYMTAFYLKSYPPTINTSITNMLRMVAKLQAVTN